MTMPKDVKYSGPRPEDKSLEQGKGKGGSSFSNDLFASIENFFYEFGLINKSDARRKEKSGLDQTAQEQDQHQTQDYSTTSYLDDDEVLLSQQNKIGQQYWQDQLLEGEEEKGYSDTHIEI